MVPLPRYGTTQKHQTDYLYEYPAAEGTASKGRVKNFLLYSTGTSSNKYFIKQTYKTKRTFAKKSE
jgi:hypothetical protein